jgi:transposase
MEKHAEVSLDQKQQILEEYQPGVRGNGFKALAKRHSINGGHTTIRKWYKKWDGTKNSLQKESGGDRRSILTEKEKKKEIVGYISKKARKNAVNYPEVKENVERKTGKDIKLRTVQEIGKNLQMTPKKTKRKTPSEGKFHAQFSLKSFLGLQDYPQLVAKFRRKCQNIKKGRLVFIDGTGMRAEPRNLKGLAPKGQPAVTKASKPEKYEPRVDMYGAIAYTGPLTCETVTSTQRKEIVNTRTKKKGVKGYTKSMPKKFLKEIGSKD